MAKLLLAFFEEPVWKQKDLERRCGVSARAIRTRIVDLQEAGFRIEREEDHPHVYYSTQPGWFGTGSSIEDVEALKVARLLGRLPRGEARDRILSRLVTSALGAPTLANAGGADVQDHVLEILENGAKRRVPVRMGYYSASRAEHGIRTLSVQRIAYGPPTSFIAFCPESAKLKWFRADRVTSPELDSSATFLEVSPSEIDALVAGSLDGFAGQGDAVACRFRVREKESHWVVRSLPRGAVASFEVDNGGTWVSLRTSALEVLARYLTGLGVIVSEIQPVELRMRVQTIAREALLGSRARLPKHSARSIRSAG